MPFWPTGWWYGDLPTSTNSVPGAISAEFGRRGQPVVEDHVRAAQRPDRLERQQARPAGSAPDQGDLSAFSRRFLVDHQDVQVPDQFGDPVSQRPEAPARDDEPGGADQAKDAGRIVGRRASRVPDGADPIGLGREGSVDHDGHRGAAGQEPPEDLPRIRDAAEDHDLAAAWIKINLHRSPFASPGPRAWVRL